MSSAAVVIGALRVKFLFQSSQSFIVYCSLLLFFLFGLGKATPLRLVVLISVDASSALIVQLFHRNLDEID